MTVPQEFDAEAIGRDRGGISFPLPFDPSKAWTKKGRHHVAGTINGVRVRGVIERAGEGFVLPFGPAWQRDCGIRPGDRVRVILYPEGPQRGELAPDIVDALNADPAAGEFFDSLAQFYRKAYLKWIDSTKLRPDLRAARIAEVTALLKAGRKERPRS